LMSEVSDSIHLRRFCRISLSQRAPDESTVRKLTRRIGAETVNNLTRALIESAVREKRSRPRAVRVDSTVIEADVKYPTDANLAAAGVKILAREGRKLAKLTNERKLRVRDRSRSTGRKLRAVTRTIRRRSGEAKREVLALTGQTGQLLARSVTEARRLATAARRHARGRGAKVKLRAAEVATAPIPHVNFASGVDTGSLMRRAYVLPADRPTPAAVITSTASSHAGSAVCRRAFWPRRTPTSYQAGREAAVDRRRPSRRRSGCRGSPAPSCRYLLRLA